MRNAKISRKCENFVKTMSFIAATISCLKEIVEFTALIARESIFKQIYELSDVYIVLVVLKSTVIFCVNPSIGRADKFLFENESCILKI